LNRSSILIISDDPEFARTVASNWRSGNHAAEITLATSDVGRPSSGAGYEVVMVGPVQSGRLSAILSELELGQNTVTISVLEDESACAFLAPKHPHVVFLPRQTGPTGRGGWIATLFAVSGEALRHVEALRRAHRAERLAIENQNYALLGRYMLEVRSSVNNALTSVLGNADLLLVERGQMTGDAREQIQTIHAMTLRLSEIMQRFSSLVTEVRLSEKESQAETEETEGRSITGARVVAGRL
jgi:signal transduction histidine kinase